MLTTWSMEGVAGKGEESRSYISNEIGWVEEKRAYGSIPLFCLVRIASTAGLMPWLIVRFGREGRKARNCLLQNEQSVYTTTLLALNVKFRDLAAQPSHKVTPSWFYLS